jgi:hypothetical protein
LSSGLRGCRAQYEYGANSGVLQRSRIAFELTPL